MGLRVSFSLSPVSGRDTGGPVTKAGLMTESAKEGDFSERNFQTADSAALLEAA